MASDPHALAPFIYFDGISCFGTNNGVIQFEMAANTLTPDEGGGVKIAISTTAHLRCSPAAAIDLRNSIDKALEMLQNTATTASTASMARN